MRHDTMAYHPYAYLHRSGTVGSRTGATAPGTKTEDSGNDGGSDRKQGRVLKFFESLQRFLGTLQGSITAVLGIIATVGAFYGAHRLVGQPSPQPTVFVTITPRATAASQGTAPPGSAPAPSVRTSATVNRTDLESLTPVQNGVDRFATHEPQQIGIITYPEAIRFSCSSSSDVMGPYNSLVYKVAGYKTLNATFGIPSDATNAAGNSATIKFYKDGGSTQLGQTYTIALDSPQKVRLPLRGSSQLEISCVAANQDDPSGDGDDIDVIIGHATLNP
jgi:hypothetical protein